ncbi:hypothetical protein A7U60_g2446 [Sanghuangporus baumii]|uniref:X-box-binding protein 1 n=1 Tax=Sanghuangporus baumii TaxID=108892 RepID=A0A9Q5N857_SANBA|nr:hypothetical protein A7U60_g2446 [Sanghuangporus baumii]
MSANTVNPSALSLPSPQSDEASSPHPSHSDTASAPPRKRQRTVMSAEERKEARAHRNRIAAQNSRDRRKAQFATLERRVAELEEENKQLRAGMTLSDLQYADARRAQEQQREKERERENAELKERIKSLEKGWEAVMKVLAAQGLPTPVPTAQSTPKSEPSPPQSDTNNTTTTFPVLVPSTPVFPITPSPSISAGGLDTTTLHSAFPSPAASVPEADFAPTPLSYELPSPAPAHEADVDAWIREIFSGSPLNASTPLPEVNTSGKGRDVPYTAPTPSAAPLIGSTEITTEWENGVEMQRLLDLFTTVQSDGPVVAANDQAMDASTALGLELCGGWNVDLVPTSSGVGVF